MHKDIKVTTPDGTFRAYVAVPAVTPAPVVVVIQEIFGVTAGIKEIADKLAGEGFLAVAPDKVGVMGFCLGGLLTFLTPARTKVDAAAFLKKHLA